MPETLIQTIDFPGGGRFQVVVHDLLKEPVDCIVNAANGALAHGGGVAAAIARAAGPRLEEEGDAIVRRQGRIPVGGAVATTAGNLPFEGVIHAVGPRMGQGDEENNIVQALTAAFQIARERGWTSLSFPAVSSGIFAVPLPVCARAYVRAVRSYFGDHPDGALQTIRLCLREGDLLKAVQAELSR